VPVIIGVIGHRDVRPSDVEVVVVGIREVVEDVRSRSSTTPVWVLTSLAEGADQVAAEVCAGLVDVDVIAVLPMPLAEYVNDFAVGEARARFASLLGACTQVLVAEDVVQSCDPGTTAIESSVQARDAAYRRCARLISDCSHVLIAAWDGKPANLPGGTADTIAYRVPSGTWSPGGRDGLWDPPGGLTVHVPVGRVSHDDEPMLGDRSGRASIPHVIDAREHDDGRMHAGWRPWVANMPDPVLKRLHEVNARLSAAPSDPADTGTGRCIRLMESYDREALRLQVRYRRIAAGLLLAGVLVLLSVSVEQSVTFGWMLGFAVVTIGATGALWWGLTRIGLKARFSVARAIAEGARVQVAWTECGVRRCVTDTYLQGEPDLQWVRRLLNAAWFADAATVERATKSPKAPLQAAHAWIDGQVAYFAGDTERSGAIARNRARADRYERISAIGASIALTSLVPEGLRLWTPVSIPAWVTDIAQSGWELGVSAAAASLAYTQLMAFSETGRRYQAALMAFRQAQRQLQGVAPDSALGIEQVVRDIGQEALSETASWLAMHRDRSIRPI